MKKSTFFIALLVFAALGVTTSLVSVQVFHSHDGQMSHAAWKDVYESPAAQIRGVDAVVVARHVGTSPGRVVIGENPEDVTPFELNHFVVTRGMKGLGEGDPLTVERVGGDANGHTILLDADGGPYVPGQEYVLFVNRQPESDFYFLVNGEGRYVVSQDGELMAAVEGEGRVAPVLSGIAVEQFAAIVDNSLRERSFEK